MTRPYRIHPATPVDAAAIADVSRQAFCDTFVDEFQMGYAADDLAAFLAKSHSKAAFDSWMVDPRVTTWVAEGDDGLAGYVLCGPTAVPHPEVGPEDVELHRLYVLKSWHGSGVGRDLMAVAMDWMAPAPAQWIGVWSGNVRAQPWRIRRSARVCRMRGPACDSGPWSSP